MKFTFSRSPSLTLARTRPATSAISSRSGELVSALVSNSNPTGRDVLNLITSSSVCVLVPWLPPIQMVRCCVPLNTSVADSLPHVGPVYKVPEQSHNGLFQPSVQLPPFWQGFKLQWFCWTWHEGFTDAESCWRAKAAISMGFPLKTKSRKQPTNPCLSVAVHKAAGTLTTA